MAQTFITLGNVVEMWRPNLVTNLVAQERSGHGGDLVTNLVTWSDLVTQEPSGHPRAIWSPFRLPEHLVVDLVVVDAFSFSRKSS